MPNRFAYSLFIFFYLRVTFEITPLTESGKEPGWRN
jgi:hypothetical protein